MSSDKIYEWRPLDDISGSTLTRGASNDSNEMIEWYKTVLGAQVLYQNDFAAFLTYDDEHHRLALFGLPGLIEKPKRSAGLDHLAFFYSTLSDWITNYERLKALGITPKGSIHHGVTMSLYYRDPDDNGIELSIDGVEKAEWHEWMRNQLGKNLMGASLDPDDLARRFHAGVPEAELRLFDPGAKLDPGVLRRIVEQEPRRSSFAEIAMTRPG